MSQTAVPPSPAENTAKKQRGRPFKAGESGNPAGRPQGARNKATVLAEAMLTGEAEALSRRAIELARQGNIPALRLCLERLLPPRRDRVVTFDLPQIETPADAAGASAAVLAACADGMLSPAEAAGIMALVETHVRTLEAAAEKRSAAREDADRQ